MNLVEPGHRFLKNGKILSLPPGQKYKYLLYKAKEGHYTYFYKPIRRA